MIYNKMNNTNKNIPFLGAINILTGKYVLPSIANKNDKYICIECKKPVILKKGEIRKHHFSHYKDNDPCNYYNHPSESQIHKDAKMCIKSLFENKTPITIKRCCISCKNDEVYTIPEITETSNIVLEHRFIHTTEKNGNEEKIADIAYIDNNEILCIFEIYNTHKTLRNERPEPWFEIDAHSLLNKSNNLIENKLDITCIRKEKCEDCIDNENNLIIEKCNLMDKQSLKILIHNNSDKDIDYYIRYKLGQRDFIRPVLNDEKPYHLRFDFDARGDNTQNDEVINCFKQFFIYKNVFIWSKKGDLLYLIEEKNKCTNDNLDNYGIDMSGSPTIEIMKRILKDYYTKNILQFSKTVVRDDNSDMYDLLKKARKDFSYNKALSNRKKLEINKIKFTESNYIACIEHPITKTKIRFALSTNKLCYNNIWFNKININILIEWYKLEDDAVLNVISSLESH